jgi:small subunit ribosomal protein S16
MAVKIRLQRHGRKKAPFYHIVIADSRSPRDGKFIEKIGTYNPMTVPATIELDRDAAFDWLQKGAQPTDTAAAILRFKGVMYRKHLQRGVNKGAVTTEQAAERYEAFVATKEKAVSDRVLKTQNEKAEIHKAIFGTPKPKKVVEAPAAESTEEAAGE